MSDSDNMYADIEAVVEKFDDEYKELLEEVMYNHKLELDSKEISGIEITEEIAGESKSIHVGISGSKLGNMVIWAGGLELVQVKFDRAAIIRRSRPGTIAVYSDVTPYTYEVENSSAQHISSVPIYIVRTESTFTIYTEKDYSQCTVDNTPTKIVANKYQKLVGKNTLSINNDVHIEIS